MLLTITILLAAFDNRLILAQTGRNIEGPSTYGQQTSPNSGSTRNRRNIMGGRTTSASKASDASRPLENSEKGQEREEDKKDAAIEKGPYNKNEQYQYVNPNDD